MLQLVRHARSVSLVGTFIAVPDQSGVGGRLVVDWRVVAVLVVEILTGAALHQLVAALLSERLADTAGTVELVLQVHLEVSVVRLAASLTDGRCGGRRVAAGGQRRRVQPGSLRVGGSVGELGEIFLQSVQLLLLLLLKSLAGDRPPPCNSYCQNPSRHAGCRTPPLPAVGLPGLDGPVLRPFFKRIASSNIAFS